MSRMMSSLKPGGTRSASMSVTKPYLYSRLVRSWISSRDMVTPCGWAAGAPGFVAVLAHRRRPLHRIETQQRSEPRALVHRTRERILLEPEEISDRGAAHDIAHDR